VSWQENLRNRERILIVLAKRHCLSLEELEQYTGIKRSELKVYLSWLAREGIITRTWGRYAGKKYRKYCLKSAIKEELGVE
jgi:DNA-binding IclR family transcriptional regulator